MGTWGLTIDVGGSSGRGGGGMSRILVGEDSMALAILDPLVVVFFAKDLGDFLGHEGPWHVPGSQGAFFARWAVNVLKRRVSHKNYEKFSIDIKG